MPKMEVKLTKQSPNNQPKIPDLSGEPIYIGIDVHKHQWQVCISAQGMIYDTYCMDPRPDELIKKLRKFYPGGDYRSVYESGFCGFWVHRALESHGIKNIVVNAADIPRRAKEQMIKTDVVDCRKLSRELERGFLTGIYIPSSEMEALRNLARLRVRICDASSKIKVQIKSFLSLFGDEVPAGLKDFRWTLGNIQRLRQVKFSQERNTSTLQHFLDVLENLRNQEGQILRRIVDEIRADPSKQKVIDLMMSIPGIGRLTAITLYTELMDIDRFRDIDHLKSYVGLSPAVYASGKKEKSLGLVWRYNRHMRNMLIESAWMAARKDPELRIRNIKLARRLGSQNAIIRIAKSLLVRIAHVWRTGLPYEIRVV